MESSNERRRRGGSNAEKGDAIRWDKDRLCTDRKYLQAAGDTNSGELACEWLSISSPLGDELTSPLPSVSIHSPFHHLTASQESSRCPSFTHFRFAPFPRQPLSTRLPHLPSSSSSPLPDLLEGLLQISVAQRLTAEECLDEERWRGVELLEPTDLGGGSAQAGGEEVQGKTLGQLLRGIVQ